MPVTDSLLAYILAATLLTLTPGLDTALVLRTATVEGGRKAFHAAMCFHGYQQLRGMTAMKTWIRPDSTLVRIMYIMLNHVDC